jgi:hypothetical protein
MSDQQHNLLERAACAEGNSHVTSRDATLQTVTAPATILDGRLRFERKIVAFCTALVHGYEPPYRDTKIISLAEFRAGRNAA